MNNFFSNELNFNDQEAKDDTCWSDEIYWFNFT